MDSRTQTDWHTDGHIRLLNPIFTHEHVAQVPVAPWFLQFPCISWSLQFPSCRKQRDLWNNRGSIGSLGSCNLQLRCGLCSLLGSLLLGFPVVPWMVLEGAFIPLFTEVPLVPACSSHCCCEVLLASPSCSSNVKVVQWDSSRFNAVVIPCEVLFGFYSSNHEGSLGSDHFGSHAWDNRDNRNFEETFFFFSRRPIWLYSRHFYHKHAIKKLSRANLTRNL